MSAAPDLKNVRVLIVEDEPFIAFDIADAISLAGGVPIGPAATVSQALALIAADGIDAAILDVNLPDGHVGPVIDALQGNSAVVVHTGVGLPPEVRQRYPDLLVCAKPTPTGSLVAHVASALGSPPGGAGRSAV